MSLHMCRTISLFFFVLVLNSCAKTTASSSTPLSGVTAISSAANANCAVLTGVVRCWGNNANGQAGTTGGATCSLGSGNVTCYKLPKTNSLISGTTISVRTGGSSACAIVDGSAKCWGKNDHGQLGNATTTNSTDAVQVSGLTANVTSIAVGSTHACAVVSGAAKCWGSNASGELGNGTTTESTSPVAVSGLTSGVSSVVAGTSVSCALTTAGAVKCWGQGNKGQLGNSATSDSSTPVSVTGLTSGVTAISASVAPSYSHVCAVVSGAAKCWGYNPYGEIGDGTIVDKSAPAAVSGLTSGVTAIAVGYYHTCAVISGAVKCWGGNYDGELGATTTDVVSTIPVSKTPIAVVGAESGNTAVSAGATHSCALNTDGTVKCWGGNGYGELGNDSTASSSSPTSVIAGS